MSMTSRARSLADKLKTAPGFSVRANSGREPHVGSMVSKFGSEAIVPGRASAEDIKGYMEQHQPKDYLGAWVEGSGEHQRTFLDESVRKRSPQAAEDFGRAQAQRAYYDVGADEVKPVRYVSPLQFHGTLFQDHPDDASKYEGLVNEQHRMGVERDLNEQRLGRGATPVPAPRYNPRGRQGKLPGIR